MISKRESPNLFSLSTEGGGVVRFGVTLRGKRVERLLKRQMVLPRLKQLHRCLPWRSSEGTSIIATESDSVPIFV